MRPIDRLLEDYGSSHQNPTNKLIHWVCVPTIFLSIVGLLASIPDGLIRSFMGQDSPYTNWALVAMILVLVYYVSLSIPLSLGMLIFSVFCLFIINTIKVTVPYPLWAVSITLFVVAWIGQFYGHKVEGKKPSFLKDIQFLLIGPAWLMHFIFRKLGIPY